MRLVALKPNSYGTRRLQAGEQFEMPDPYARTLLVMGLARRAFIESKIDDEVPRLRADAQAVGIDVDLRWGARRLRAEIEAKQKWGS